MPNTVRRIGPLLAIVLTASAWAGPPPALAESPTLQLTTPATGQVFSAGEICLITWTSAGLTGPVYLDLYKGSEYTMTIGSPSVLAGQFDWTIPQIIANGSDYYIAARGQGTYGGSIPQSNVFVIQGSGLAPFLLGPQPGEVLDAGSTYTIQWVPLDGHGLCDESVALYLDKLGQYYGYLGRPYASGSSFEWTICPTIEPGSDYTLRMETRICDQTYTSRTELPFTIRSDGPPTLTLLSPSEGDTITVGQAVSLRWAATGLSGQQVCASLVADDGTPQNLGCAPASTGQMIVDLCPALVDGWYRLEIAAVCSVGPTLTSHRLVQAYNPAGNAPLQITAPTGGEVFRAGSQFLLTWNGPEIDPLDVNQWFNLELYDGPRWMGSPPGGLLGPNQAVVSLCSALADGANYRVRLTIHNCAGDHAVETLPFTIQGGRQPALTLLSPNGGETLHAGQPVTVRWTGVDLGSSVYVTLRRSSDPYMYYRLGSAPAAVGQLTASLCPGIEDGSDYKAEVSSYYGCGSVQDASDDAISILGGLPRPLATITSPAEGDAWITGSEQKVTWTGTDLRGHVWAELWRANHFVNNLPGADAQSGEFTWNACAEAPGDDYRIVFKIYECGKTQTFSSGSFTILPDDQPPPTLTVTSPNGGEVLAAGTHLVITWASTNPRGDVWIDLMEGDRWFSLGEAPMGDGRFEWDLCSRELADGYYTVRISQADCPWSVEDFSDAPFTITGMTPGLPEVTLVSPSWGDVVQAGQTVSVTWTAQNPAGMLSVMLWKNSWPFLDLGQALMSDGGFTWPVCPWLEPGSRYSIALMMNDCGGWYFLDEGWTFTIAGSGLPSADLDFDCDVDADDLERFQPCTTGPGAPYNLDEPPADCRTYFAGDAFLGADLDRDGDVDQADFGLLQRSFTEP